MLKPNVADKHSRVNCFASCHVLLCSTLEHHNVCSYGWLCQSYNVQCPLSYSNSDIPFALLPVSMKLLVTYLEISSFDHPGHPCTSQQPILGDKMIKMRGKSQEMPCQVMLWWIFFPHSKLFVRLVSLESIPLSADYHRRNSCLLHYWVDSELNSEGFLNDYRGWILPNFGNFYLWTLSEAVAKPWNVPWAQCCIRTRNSLRYIFENSLSWVEAELNLCSGNHVKNLQRRGPQTLINDLQSSLFYALWMKSIP